MATDADVVVVGGGVVGLACAYAVARDGRRVTVVDPSPMEGATRAAAGMLAPGAEASPEERRLASITRRSRAAWPGLLQSVAEDAGVAVAIHDAGSLLLGWDDGDHRELRRMVETLEGQRIVVERVARAERAELFTGTSPRLTAGYFVADDAYLDPDEVAPALLAAVQRRGGELVREACADVGVSVDRAWAETQSGRITARCGVIATGATPPPGRVFAASEHTVRPVRGVTVRIAGPPRSPRPMLRGLVRGRSVYVIGRDDGTVVIGASSDESWERVAPVGAVRRLLEDAATLWPEIDEFALVETRVGLRPAPRGHTPFFDVAADGRWAWTSGFYRHGWLLAPWVASQAAVFASEAP